MMAEQRQSSRNMWELTSLEQDTDDLLAMAWVFWNLQACSPWHISKTATPANLSQWLWLGTKYSNVNLWGIPIQTVGAENHLWSNVIKFLALL